MSVPKPTVCTNCGRIVLLDPPLMKIMEDIAQVHGNDVDIVVDNKRPDLLKIYPRHENQYLGSKLFQETLTKLDPSCHYFVSLDGQFGIVKLTIYHLGGEEHDRCDNLA